MKSKFYAIAVVALVMVMASCKKECTECHNPYGSSLICPEPDGCVICRSDYNSYDEYQSAVDVYKLSGYDCKIK